MTKRKSSAERIRCPWAVGDQYIEYHDAEWGVPVHDDRVLFEFLILEGAQAGLSWATICYAFMQAVGMVNDDLAECFRHFELQRQDHTLCGYE